jgi:hypothetical protein
MTIAELLTLARGIYLSEGIGDYLWIDSLALSMFSEAQRQACNRTDFIFEEFSIPLVSGTSSYALSNRITRLHDVMFQGVTVTKRSIAELDHTNSTWRSDSAMSGKDCGYAIRGDKIRFIPAPAIDDDGLMVTLECNVMPATSFTSMSDTPVIPAESHRELIHWVLHEAFAQVDIQKSAFYLEKFNMAFGRYVSAQVRQHQLENGLSLVASPFNYGASSRRDNISDNW